MQLQSRWLDIKTLVCTTNQKRNGSLGSNNRFVWLICCHVELTKFACYPLDVVCFSMLVHDLAKSIDYRVLPPKVSRQSLTSEEPGRRLSIQQRIANRGVCCTQPKGKMTLMLELWYIFLGWGEYCWKTNASLLIFGIAKDFKWFQHIRNLDNRSFPLGDRNIDSWLGQYRIPKITSD